MPALSLYETETLPDELWTLPAQDIHQILPGPTLYHSRGRRERPLFVSVLLHGNESTGWEAIRELMQEYRDKPLPRSLSLFIGNVEAAKHQQRRLPGQPDYNRVWPGGEEFKDTPEAAVMRRVVALMRLRQPCMSVDVHNNTGLNPHYACINRLDSNFLHLARLFSRTIVYFLKPTGVQSAAFAEYCPSVTLECGAINTQQGLAHAKEFLNACLHLSALPAHPVLEQDVDLFHTVARVQVMPEIPFGFGESEVDLRFSPDLDHLNFRELPIHTVLGSVSGDYGRYLQVQDEQGNEVGGEYFEIHQGMLRTLRPLMPAMFTLNKEVIRQDCLGYIMERLPLTN